MTGVLDSLRGRGLRRMVAPWTVPPGRNVHVHESDRWIVSYPRSGNTWLRFMIGSLVNGAPATFSGINGWVPDIYVVPSWRLRRFQPPRVLKSHEPHDSRYRHVVYLVRDPRDVAVSYLYYSIRRGWAETDITFASWVDRFLSDDPLLFGRWDRHAEAWSRNPQALIVRYEDMLEAPGTTLDKIVAHLEIEPVATVDDAVGWSTAERMRRSDREDTGRSRADPATVAGYDFIRTAAAGRGAAELPITESRRIVDKFGATMQAFGYL